MTAAGKDKDPKATVCVGAIAGAFGVRGEVRLKSFCAVAEDIAAYGAVTAEDGGRSFTIRITRPIKGGLAARLSGVATREEAEALRGTRLHVARDRLPRLPDDEFYHADLVGLAVQDTGGAPLGRVHAVHDHGAGDLLEVRGDGSTLLLPFTRWAVPTVDLTAGLLVADPPPETEAEAEDTDDSEGERPDGG
ncbi:MAG: ribosome maturation factor RimM [Pseudomonadota bacterium]